VCRMSEPVLDRGFNRLAPSSDTLQNETDNVTDGKLQSSRGDDSSLIRRFAEYVYGMDTKSVVLCLSGRI
jgi:hypothetical protein